MKIFDEKNEPKRCSKCDGDDFKPAGNNQFTCRNCDEPETGTAKTGETK